MRSILTLFVASALAAPALAAPVTYTVAMTGAAEVPAAEKGMGTATFAFDAAKNEVCYTLNTMDIDTPTAAHIHKGAAGVAGPPVVMLKAPATGTVKDCTPVAAEVMTAILASPSDYYVNVHSAAFPKGGMRGQLK